MRRATAKTDRPESRIPRDVNETLVKSPSLSGQGLTNFVVSSATDAVRRAI